MAVEKTINLNVNTKGAQKNVNDLEKAVEGVNNEVKDTGASTQAMGNTVDKATGGAVSKFKAFKGGLTSVIASFKSLRIAILATGIGALLIAVTSLGQAFTRSEEGQNKFAKILGVIGSVTGNLLDLLADLGEKIISVFENPKQAILDFANLIKENIINRFEGLIELIPQLGKAITLLFEGEFSEAGKVATDAVGKVALGVDSVTDSVGNAVDAVKEFGKEVADDAAKAAKIADQRAKAEKMARALVVERAEAERKIAEIREKAADKENFTAEERIELLKEAGAISEDLANKETEVARIRLKAKQTENALTKSNKADLDEEAQLKADLINKETQRLKLQKALTAEVTTATREASAEAKAAAAEEKAEAKALADFKKTLRDAEAVSEQQKRDLELIKIQEHYDNLIAQAEENNIKTDQLEAARDEAKRLKQEEFDKKDAEARKKIADDVIALEQQKTAAKQKALDDAITLAGAETGVGKALLIVKQGLALKEMIMEAKKTITFSKLAVAKSTTAVAEGTAQTAKIGFPQNIPMLIGYAAQAAGIISAIKSATGAANSVAGTLGGGSASGGGASASTSQPPSFNIVGATETSQLAEAVGSQTQQPIQAYVVANDVTTAQSLENNIVEGATL